MLKAKKQVLSSTLPPDSGGVAKGITRLSGDRRVFPTVYFVIAVTTQHHNPGGQIYEQI
jgi:hypothetical protein